MNTYSPAILDRDDLALWKLSPEDQEYVLAIIRGESQKAAYQAGHPKAKDSTAYVEGSRRIRRPNIQQAIEELNRERMYRLRVQLCALAVPALRNVARAVEEGDLAVSLDVLNRVGLSPRMIAELDLTSRASTDVDTMAAWSDQ